MGNTKKGAAAGTATPEAQPEELKPKDGAREPAGQDPDWLPVPVPGCEGYEVHRELLRVRSWHTRGNAGVRRHEPTMLILARDTRVTLRVQGVSIQFPVWALQRAALGDQEGIDAVDRLVRRERRAPAPRSPQDVAPPALIVPDGVGDLLGNTCPGPATRAPLDTGELAASFREFEARMERLAARIERLPEQVSIEVDRAVAPLVGRVETLASRPEAAERVPASTSATSEAIRSLKSAGTPREMQLYQAAALVEGVGVEAAASLLRMETRLLAALLAGKLAELDVAGSRRLDIAYVCWRDDRLAGTDSTYEAMQGRMSALRRLSRRAAVEQTAWAMEDR